MELVPVRCRIPEHLRKIGKTQQWLADELGMSKQHLSDYIKMRSIFGMKSAKNVAVVLKLPSSDDIYEWEWRGE